MSKLLESLINKKQANSDGELSVKEEFENQLNPMQQADWKVILGIRKKQMEEAAQQGVPTEHLLAQIIKPKNVFDKGGIEQDVQGQVTGVRQPGMIPTIANSVLGQSGNSENLLKQLLDVQKLQQSPMEMEEKTTLIAQRKANTALMEKMLKGQEEGSSANIIYRDPITGAEVDPEIAEADMEAGLGVYQKNQILSTRSGIVEKPLNKVPDLTQEEKKYVNDARILNQSLIKLDTGFDSLFNKYGNRNDWKAFSIEKLPYFLDRDPEVQNLKSELIYLKAAIPFLRGGKQLTITEAKRVDVMLNPFGKNKETFKKDLQRFENEFMAGSDIMKFGINAGIMKKLIKGDRQKKSTQQTSEIIEDGYRFKGGNKADPKNWEKI